MNFFQNAVDIANGAANLGASGLHTSRVTGATQYRASQAHVMSVAEHNATVDRIDLMYANAQTAQVIRMDEDGNGVVNMPIPGAAG